MSSRFQRDSIHDHHGEDFDSRKSLCPIHKHEREREKEREREREREISKKKQSDPTPET